MSEIPRTVRAAVKRAHAETYLLISLTAFAGSVILTRLFLDLAGYPQVGNSVLHIAHALWGGLLLLLAAILPLLLANRWARMLSAVFSGLGVGLFIDEIGKFITQKNDYFFPPAAPVVYAVFLLLVLLFIFVRRRGEPDPRAEMYRALSNLSELLDNNLDVRELEELQEIWRLPSKPINRTWLAWRKPYRCTCVRPNFPSCRPSQACGRDSGPHWNDGGGALDAGLTAWPSFWPWRS